MQHAAVVSECKMPGLHMTSHVACLVHCQYQDSCLQGSQPCSSEVALVGGIANSLFTPFMVTEVHSISAMGMQVRGGRTCRWL